MTSRLTAKAFPAAAVLLPLTSACLLRSWLGVRPFPSIDELAYAPSFRAAVDPAPYARDLMVSGMPNHAFVWSLTFRLAEASGHLATVMYALTFVLSVLLLIAVFRLLRALHVPGALLPVAAILAFATVLNGFGRGTYDGAFGLGLHGQWMALIALLMAYGSLARERFVVTGIWLGIAVLSHVAVAVHGVVVVVFGIAASRPRSDWLRTLVRIGIACALVGAPVILSILVSLSRPQAAVLAANHAALSQVPGVDMIQDLWRRRLIHEFSWNVSLFEGIALPLYLLAGVVGLRMLRGKADAVTAARVVSGLLVGHLLIALAALIFYGPLADASQIPYLLSLTRTTPLLIVLCATTAVAALERIVIESSNERTVVVLATPMLLLLIIFVAWTPELAALLAFGSVALAAVLKTRSLRMQWVATAFGIVTCAAALVHAVARDQRTVDVAPSDAALFAYARTASPPDALFIVPPGLDGFRFFAQRAVYVDWRLFPTPAPKLLPVWFARLKEVAAPDDSILKTRGWDSVPLWDASYARRNTPDRIAHLLSDTGADYFVSDISQRKAIRPDSRDLSSAGLETTFVNSRFVVYRRQTNAGGHD